MLLWWGLYMLSLSHTDAWLVAGPILITLLFVFVSVKLMEDRQLANKGGAFREYQRKVGSALLILPKGVNEAIGGWLFKEDYMEK
jgi:steroid 5-alpha reductase family enzyme